MSSVHESNPFAAYLTHLSAVPLGIYKTGYSFSANNHTSTFSGYLRSTCNVDCGADVTFQSAKSMETEPLETPKDLKNSEKTHCSNQLPATHLTFSSLSSAIHSGDIVNHHEASSSTNAQPDSTFDDIPPDLWQKISRISALLQNVAISMPNSKNYSESSRFMSRLSESNAQSSSFDTSLGSFSASMRSSDLKQIANMLGDVINSSHRSEQSNGVSTLEAKLGREIDELVAQYNDMAALASSSGPEIPLIYPTLSVK